MRIALCIEQSGGMSFNGRRVSQDRILRNKLFSLLDVNERLYMNAYSSKQFESNEALCCREDFLEKAGSGDICFVETVPPPLEKAEELFIFQWNRAYPADIFFTFDPNTAGFELITTEEFEGSSHKNITLNVYRRK